MYHRITCPIVHLLSCTPAAYHNWSRRLHHSSHNGLGVYNHLPGVYDHLPHWHHCYAAGADLMSCWAPGLARVGRIANRANREAPKTAESRESRGAL
jgi:hypothetical protein